MDGNLRFRAWWMARGLVLNRLIPLLEAQKHRVIALDLPSHGRDKTPTAKETMRDYVDTVVAQLDALP